MQEALVWSLIRELRSHLPVVQTKKKKKSIRGAIRPSVFSQIDHSSSIHQETTRFIHKEVEAERHQIRETKHCKESKAKLLLKMGPDSIDESQPEVRGQEALQRQFVSISPLWSVGETK